MINAFRTTWTKSHTVRGWVFGVVAAAALVTTAIVFIAGLAVSAVAGPLGEHILRSNGALFDPARALTGARVETGAATLLAVVAVLALGVLLLLAWTALTLVLARLLLRRRDA